MGLHGLLQGYLYFFTLLYLLNNNNNNIIIIIILITINISVFKCAYLPFLATEKNGSNALFILDVGSDQVVYLTTLSLSRPYSGDVMMINECGTAGGMKTKFMPKLRGNECLSDTPGNLFLRKASVFIQRTGGLLGPRPFLYNVGESNARTEWVSPHERL
jgi:hypothetical protein